MSESRSSLKDLLLLPLMLSPEHVTALGGDAHDSGRFGLRIHVLLAQLRFLWPGCPALCRIELFPGFHQRPRHQRQSYRGKSLTKASPFPRFTVLCGMFPTGATNPSPLPRTISWSPPVNLAPRPVFRPASITTPSTTSMMSGQSRRATSICCTSSRKPSRFTASCLKSGMWNLVTISGREIYRIDLFDSAGKFTSYWQDEGCNSILVTSVKIDAAGTPIP